MRFLIIFSFPYFLISSAHHNFINHNALSNKSHQKKREKITNPDRGDGFGAQFETIIWTAFYAEFNNKKFFYTPFKTMEHNYNEDNDFIKKKEWLINFMENFPINKGTIKSPWSPYDYVDFFEQNLEKCEKSRSLRKIKKVFRKNKNRQNYFDNKYFNVAIHIRRSNSHDIGKLFYIPDENYLEIIENLRKKYSDQHPLFHIYSQGNSNYFKRVFNALDIILHINDSIEDTFTSMVLADALITSNSSLSYAAGLISNGIIYYIPFVHRPLPHWIILPYNYMTQMYGEKF